MKKILFTLMTVLLASMAAQAATNYGFSVGGTTVTSDNCNNITSNYITSGTVSYDPSSNTLFLNNVTINMTGSNNRCINNLECSDLTIFFRGTCNLKAQDAAAIRIRKSTTLFAPQATDVVNITGVNENGIWMATSNDFDLYILGPGTFNISSTNNTAIEDEDNGSGANLHVWHEVYFDNVNAVLSSGGNSVVKRVLLRFKAGSSVRFKATNNSSYPVINYCGWQVYGNETLLEPSGAYYSGNTVKDSSGNSVYNQDVYVSDDYVAIINATNFPDANFRSYLLALYPKGYITQTNVTDRTFMDLSNRSISNLQGIEYFTNMLVIYLDHNNLTSLSRLSSLTKLTKLLCQDNQLTSLDLSPFTNLEHLNCSYNKLTTLNASGKSSLKYLLCQNNTSLTTLNCYSDNLTTLNVTGCTALKTLKCYYNANLAAITGLADCTAITYLDCEDCAITSLSSALTSLTNIEKLYARNNQLTTLTIVGKSRLGYLRVSGNTSMTNLYCYDNALSTLDISNCTALEKLWCWNNANLTAITGLASCKAVKSFYCYDCALTSLDGVSYMSNLEALGCYNNKLTTLSVTGKSNLTYLNCSNNTTMTNLNCCQNALTTLNVTGNTALKELICYNNSNLTSITGLTDCTAITYLDCDDCSITELSAVQSMNNIKTLTARNNKLTSLSILNKSNLTYVRVSGNTLMTFIQVYNCALNSFYVTGCTKLETLACAHNQLTSLDVTGCSALKTIQCSVNRISGTGMTTLVNSLPTRSASNKGTLNVIHTTDENNSMTAAQITTARNKYWMPCRWNGSAWVEMTAFLLGDVNGDGVVNITDVTTLIQMLLTGAPSASAYPAADMNGDGNINITDVTTLITQVMNN